METVAMEMSNNSTDSVCVQFRYKKKGGRCVSHAEQMSIITLALHVNKCGSQRKKLIFGFSCEN